MQIRASVFALAGAALFAIVLSGHAQPQSQQAITLPQLTIDQRWDRLQNNWYAFVIVGIAHAKARAESAEQYGEAIGKVFAPSWESSRGKGAAALATGLAANVQMFRGSTFEIVDASDTSVRGRYTWGEGLKNRIAAYSRTGVTVEDVYRTIGKAQQEIADYLSLEYAETRVGDQITFTITEKKPRVSR